MVRKLYYNFNQIELIMDRKVYIKPSIQIEDVVVEAMLAASITVGEDVEVMETDVKNRRGSWGNLWE